MSMRQLLPDNGGGREIAQALLTYRSALVHAGVFSGVMAVVMLAPTVYMLQIYDRVLISGNEDTLWMLTIIVLMAYAIIGALEWARGMVVWSLGVEFDKKLGARVFDAAFVANLKTGRLNALQPLEDLQQLRQFATGPWLLALFDAPWSPVYVLLMFYFHSALGWFALGGVLVLLALGWLNERVSRSHLQKAGELMIASNREADANLRNADVIAGMGMLVNLRRRWADRHQAYVREQSLAQVRMTRIQAWNKALRLTMQSLALGMCAWLVLRHEMTAGMMIAGSVLLSRALTPIDQIVGASRHWVHVKEARRRLSQLLDAFSPQAGGMDFSQPKGGVHVEQLLAALPDSTQLTLRGISFKLEPGETMAVVGSSGAGKSTLARCLVNAWQPLRGKVLLDGVPLNQWQPGSLGALVGYLPQDVQLFAGTVGENIARFNVADESKVIAAAEMAGAHELILQLPEGYQTRLGENGKGLSGGQRQRVGLARALYGKPCLVVLDEPNANLDEMGAAMLTQAVARMKQAGITLILITHKSNILQQADKMLVLHAGAQVDFGSSAEVMARRQRAISSTSRL